MFVLTLKKEKNNESCSISQYNILDFKTTINELDGMTFNYDLYLIMVISQTLGEWCEMKNMKVSKHRCQSIHGFFKRHRKRQFLSQQV